MAPVSPELMALGNCGDLSDCSRYDLCVGSDTHRRKDYVFRQHTETGEHTIAATSVGPGSGSETSPWALHSHQGADDSKRAKDGPLSPRHDPPQASLAK